MPTLKLALLAMIMGFGFPGPASAETAAKTDKDAHHGQHTQDWSGVYFGSLPCADCYGVKTSLALNANNTYILITQNLGKSPREFTEKGKFAWDEKSGIIVLTPKKGDGSRQFLVAENQLIELDAKGNRFTGKEAERYILRRADTSELSEKHSH